MKKIIVPVVMIMVFIIILFNFHCVSQAKPEPFALAQLTPAPLQPANNPEPAVAKADPRPAATPAPTAVPILIEAKVIEMISNTRVLISKGSTDQGIKIGLIGDVFNDAGKSQPIAKAKIVEIMPKFSYADLSGIIQKINKQTALVVFTIPGK